MPSSSTSAGRPLAPRGTKSKTATSSDRRGEILLAALELFATVGYRATTMADIGEAVGIRGPSIYKHVASKQDLLAEITISAMTDLLDRQRQALAEGGTVLELLRRAVEVHVRTHAENRYETFVGQREIDNLEEPRRSTLLGMRRQYETNFRKLVADGQRQGLFHVESDRLTSYAIVDMGIGVATWYNPRGAFSPAEAATIYADLVEQMVTGRPTR